MNLAPDNTAPVEEIQRQLAFHEILAAHYKKLLQKSLEPASDRSESLGPPQPQPPDAVPAPAPHTSTGDPSLTTHRVAKWPDAPCQRRAVSQQQPQQHHLRQAHQQQQPDAVAQSMRRAASCRSDQGLPPQQPAPPSLSPSSRAFAARGTPAGQLPAGKLLPSVQEDAGPPDVGLTPDVYLAKNWLDEQSYLTRTSLSPGDTYNSPGPSACPSMISGSSIVDPSHPLTRQGSSFDSNPSAAMLRFVSSQSWQTDASAGCPDAAMSSFDAGARKRSTCDQDFFGVGAGFIHDPSRHYPSSAPTPGPNLFAPSAAMERSVSSASAASAKSTNSNLERRFKEACQRVRQNSSRNVIAPKPREAPAEKASTTAMATPTAAATAAAAAAAAAATSKREGKLALQKTPYQRPKHPRVYCNQCDEYPDGFRGDHELRRHLNAKHKGIVKKFVCRDPAAVGISSKVKALYPLSECRACSSKKQYGAYYNAAAHLRRTHFKPRAPRGKNKGPTEERRGGKGGGDWPPMADLKLWYEEVLVASDGTNSLDDTCDMMDEDMFDNGEDVAMGIFPDLDGVPATFGVDVTQYGLSAPSAPVEGHRLQDAVGGFPLSTGTVSGPAAANYLSYGQVPYADGSSAAGEYTFSGAGKVAGFGSANSTFNTAVSFYEQSPQIMADCLWNADGVATSTA
ncbi:hypothetical protein CDD83_1459 [Cordyceps sp. RAO-2017]|nr:hypothetical protein CDD83_1459 [Cordyceps sp. RAO-2017]